MEHISGADKKLIAGSIGKRISALFLDADKNALRIAFEDGAKIRVTDEGQDCCELRYLHSDDDATRFVGATLLGIEVASTEEAKDGEYGDVHEIAFLNVRTSAGIYQLTTHNEHNGYYGGFDLRVVSDE